MLKRNDYRCHRSDVCVFSKRHLDTGVITSFLILHVDDILICASEKDLADFWKMISNEFRTGPLTFLREGPMVFCGLLIRLGGESIAITQDEYRANLPELVRSHFFGESRLFRTEKQLSKITRAIVGPCIWMCQTRYDISFLTLQAATLISSACRDSSFLEQLFGVFQRIYKVLFGSPMSIWFRKIPDVSALSRFQIITFSDAGLGTLLGHSSIESGYM